VVRLRLPKAGSGALAVSARTSTTSHRRSAASTTRRPCARHGAAPIACLPNVNTYSPSVGYALLRSPRRARRGEVPFRRGDLAALSLPRSPNDMVDALLRAGPDRQGPLAGRGYGAARPTGLFLTTADPLHLARGSEAVPQTGSRLLRARRLALRLAGRRARGGPPFELAPGSEGPSFPRPWQGRWPWPRTAGYERAEELCTPVGTPPGVPHFLPFPHLRALSV